MTSPSPSMTELSGEQNVLATCQCQAFLTFRKTATRVGEPTRHSEASNLQARLPVWPSVAADSTLSYRAARLFRPCRQRGPPSTPEPNPSNLVPRLERGYPLAMKNRPVENIGAECGSPLFEIAAYRVSPTQWTKEREELRGTVRSMMILPSVLEVATVEQIQRYEDRFMDPLA